MRPSKLSILGIATALALAACDRPVNVARAPQPAADNTGINERDRGATTTPMDQSNSERDLTATSEIRQAITDDDSLSINAQNVKVVTNAGVVVLRGPVASEQERATIVAIAQRAPGVVRVDDQLEIAAE
jgi:osmotically-inducible protein OsmY